VRPSYDFVQQLLWNREQIEVLSPEEFRNQIIGMLRQMLGRYVP
ncbi:WYL domain-containing protein, partial [Parabacteroides distasonis]|nr:WYL domain-containing protein [Parabacteroides distasonis]